MAFHSLSILLRLFVLSTTIHPHTVLSAPLDDFYKGVVSRAACKIEDARLTTDAATPLQPPSDDVKVIHVAIGKGSQNYTCLTNSPNDAPAFVGALATLFDASCIASGNPTKLSQLPKEALQTELPADESKTLTSSNIMVSGHHYFPNPQTPTFDLVTAAANLGSVAAKKVDAKPAPPNAIVGKNNKGDGAVAWLKLTGNSNIKEVYRVNTAGGNPPKTCQDMPKDFQVQYAAEYWFFGAKNSDGVTGNPKDKSPGNPKDKGPENPKDKSPGNPKDKGPENPKDKSPENPKDKSPENPKDKSPENSKDKSPGNPKDKSPENPKDKSPGNPKDKSPENPKDKSPGNPKDKSPENPKDKSPENPKDKSPENPKDKSPENPKDKSP